MDNKSNYRPISVLPAIWMLFEQLITKKLCQFMVKMAYSLLINQAFYTYIPL